MLFFHRTFPPSSVGGSDFTSTSSTLNFPSGTVAGDTQEFNFSIINDNDVEDDETVEVTADILAGGIFTVNVPIGSAIVIIEDDDFVFNQDTPTVNGNDITISFATSAVVQSIECAYTAETTVDCEYSTELYTSCAHWLQLLYIVGSRKICQFSYTLAHADLY